MKRKLFGITLILSANLLLAPQNLMAQSDDKTITITVSGSGKTQDEAKESALRSAIEQAFGAFISSKTEILNDQIVADEIISVANGNIKSYEILNASQLPDESWGVTLKALVSVSKLASFVEAKGITIEIKGGMFALNIKQQLLNEQGEIKAVAQMVGLLHEPMQISFDYTINSSEPKSLDTESKDWEIPLVVTATANKNMDFCANYCIKTLAALSLSSEEIINYQKLNKSVFNVSINYKGATKFFYLRRQISINAIETLTDQWGFYTRLFAVKSGIYEINYSANEMVVVDNRVYEGAFFIVDDMAGYDRWGSKGIILFISSGQQACTFTFRDKRTLAQIEQMTNYVVKSIGIVSKFKHGGFVLYEENGHGLIAAIYDLGVLNWVDAKKVCDELILNGYNDWHLPEKDELNSLYTYLKKVNIGGFANDWYWSSTEYENNVWTLNFGFSTKYGYYSFDNKDRMNRVRAVRSF